MGTYHDLMITHIQLNKNIKFFLKPPKIVTKVMALENFTWKDKENVSNVVVK